MIITVYSRVNTFTERLDHYHTLDRLGQILVLWNNPDFPPPQLLYTNYSIPVEVLKMDRNSLNNRFYPWPKIMYSCIVNMVSQLPPSPGLAARWLTFACSCRMMVRLLYLRRGS